MKGILYRAMVEKKPIEIIYISKHNVFSQRRILIKELKGSNILAYCLTRKQMRIFNLNRMMSIAPKNSNMKIG